MTLSSKIISIKSGQPVLLRDIPVLPYPEFKSEVLSLLGNEGNHCVSYFAVEKENGLSFFCAIANDSVGSVYVCSHQGNKRGLTLESLSAIHFPLHIFEREISENFGVVFEGHPWDKPVRFAHNRFNPNQKVNDYPFYSIKSDELHEVGVGPIHAGIIEPGHFRFICNGEQVLHLEIQLGWQHRGIESLMIQENSLLKKNLLAENIAGDTAVGHSLAFVSALEALGNKGINKRLNLERAIALELERIAIHTADISALCTDIAYNLGSNVFGVLRTGIINMTQRWCGNRLGKSMIRPGGSHFLLTADLKQNLLSVLEDYEIRFTEMAGLAFSLPSLENRFDQVGTITTRQARLIGSVGMAARMAGVNRDIRASHPFAGFSDLPYEPAILTTGDVFARFLLRRKEIEASLAWIHKALQLLDDSPVPEPDYSFTLNEDSFVVSLAEGWRGEICHCALTGNNGDLVHYKIKDPAMHNWKSLELSLRNLEISDFPINNKSYNLSYCGFDL